jgi:hypothetical protein
MTVFINFIRYLSLERDFVFDVYLLVRTKPSCCSPKILGNPDIFSPPEMNSLYFKGKTTNFQGKRPPWVERAPSDPLTAITSSPIV